jgi:hypothetical protein
MSAFRVKKILQRDLCEFPTGVARPANRAFIGRIINFEPHSTGLNRVDTSTGSSLLSAPNIGPDRIGYLPSDMVF